MTPATPPAGGPPVLTDPTPYPSFSCPPGSELCHYLYQYTGQSWLAASGYYVVVKPIRILLIVLAAMIIRYVIRRAIRRLVSGTARARSAVSPWRLRSRFPAALREATGLVSERRQQRAEALGSILSNIASVTILAITAMFILAELGVNLAPILASAGIVGVAVGFGAQNLVKDFITGIFVLFEDQYGVGDVVEIGTVTGTVEAVGLRITTVRDRRGVMWYIRNGEILRVGNSSQGWSVVTVDIPIEFAAVKEALRVLQEAVEALAKSPQWSDDLLEPPEVLGVEELTADSAVLRTTAKTTPTAQARLGRELRRRLTEALDQAGVTASPDVPQP